MSVILVLRLLPLVRWLSSYAGQKGGSYYARINACAKSVTKVYKKIEICNFLKRFGRFLWKYVTFLIFMLQNLGICAL